ncbi:D-serine dehydratase [Devosia enhydra]|uniref:D-serine dehydratase n=1 Tax=Devosia enhydra TaxID=665118 RepID=A0A1K2I2N3_9HYPH|nr:alanine racemase [Devosia enhydra]SFZ86503.1 D-serine dehydratase [Devosia enhydra]
MSRPALPFDAALPPLELDMLKANPLDPSTKGLPAGAGAVSLNDIAAAGWNLLAEDLPLPQAVIRKDVLDANSHWMSRFTGLNGLRIAPHGKTTMAPQLYDVQARDGAWAITVATTQQMGVALRFGTRRVLLANQPVGPKAVDAIFLALAADPSVEIYCLADSLEGVAQLAAGAGRHQGAARNPLRVLVEIGMTGARTGAQSPETAQAVARAVAGQDALMLAGFECFEGVLPNTATVDAMVDAVVAAARAAEAEGLLSADQPLILSAGGSAYFDRVGERFGPASFSRPVIKLLRSGCYLTHDALSYAKAFKRIVAETSLALPEGELMPALEVWAYVQSRPEPGKALLTMGKRDIGNDAGMPRPERWYRPGSGMSGPEPMPEGHQLTGLNDQHAHLQVPHESPLKVGDMVAFGIGHPCTTFDKWGLLMVVDENYRIVDAVKTFF